MNKGQILTKLALGEINQQEALDLLQGESKKTRVVDFWRVVKEAHGAGMEAVKNCVPTPMIVGEPTTPLGNDIDKTKSIYFVESGVCGFAWILVKDSRTAFSKFLIKNELGKHSDYHKGVMVWVSDFGQSMEKKEKYANAYAEVLKKYGIKCWAQSRMD